MNAEIWWESQMDRDHLEDLHLDWSIILRRILKGEKDWSGMDCFDLVQDRG
jgi:hypothetical protein